MKVLLLQARYADDPAKQEEVDSFQKVAGLDEGSITSHDLLLGAPPIKTLDDFDALMVGGSGDFYLTQGDLPHQQSTLEFLRMTVEIGHPVFASCFGYQCLVLALGGELVFDPETAEVGTYDLHLTEAGRSDDIFSQLPASFPAQLGHKDRTLRPPVATDNLCYSKDCAHQALRVHDRLVWATQFHPELDRATNYGRFLRYMDGYSEYLSPEEQDRAHLRFRETPETLGLLPLFVERVRARGV
jgi:GMP synthase (glutamine-hydrolysing)